MRPPLVIFFCTPPNGLTKFMPTMPGGLLESPGDPLPSHLLALHMIDIGPTQL